MRRNVRVCRGMEMRRGTRRAEMWHGTRSAEMCAAAGMPSAAWVTTAARMSAGWLRQRYPTRRAQDETDCAEARRHSR